MNENLNTFGGIACVFLFLAIGVLLVQITHHRETRRQQTQLFLISYFVRTAMVIAVYYLGLINIIKDEDSAGWYGGLGLYNLWVEEGQNIFTLPGAIYKYLQDSTSGSGSDGGRLHIGYFIILASEFLILNAPGRIPAAMLNVLVGAWVPVLAYRLSMQIFDNPRAARYAGLALAFMPSLVLFSAQTLKEPIVVFLEVLGLYSCVQICQLKFRVRYFAALLFASCTVYYLRYYVVYVFATTFFLALTIPIVFKSKFRNAFIIFGFLISPVVFLLAYQSAIDEITEIKNEQTRRLMSYRSGFGQGDNMQTSSNVDNPFDITQTSQLIPGFLFGFVHLMFAPLPWHLARGSLRMLLTAPEMLWWYYNGTIRLVRGFREGMRINFADMLLPALFIAPLLFFYSLIFNNIGLAYRYRAQVLPELMLFVSLGYYQLKINMSTFYEDSEYLNETQEQFPRQQWPPRPSQGQGQFREPFGPPGPGFGNQQFGPGPGFGNQQPGPARQNPRIGNRF